MTSETQTNSNEVGRYSYNADGQRVRRKIDGVETWQVYGMDGELLITAEAATGTRSNVALTANGATATAQNYTQDSTYPGMHFQPALAIDGVRHTSTDGASYWRDEHGLSSWLQVDFNGSKSIDEVDVYTMGDYPFYTTNTDPSAGQTFSGVQLWAIG